MRDDLHVLADETARELRTYLTAVREIAAGAQPDSAIPMLLLTTSQVLATGARLGAIGDVVPEERFEPDAGPDADVEPVRTAFAVLFDGLDEYCDVVDPLLSAELSKSLISDDVATICSAAAYGLSHHEAGRALEAMWWWQYSYLSSWGERAAALMRALTAILSHVRLDADDETVAEAQFDALHATDALGS